MVENLGRRDKREVKWEKGETFFNCYYALFDAKSRA